MNDLAIETSHLTRYFGAKRVVYDLNLAVPRGQSSAFWAEMARGRRQRCG